MALKLTQMECPSQAAASDTTGPNPLVLMDRSAEGGSMDLTGTVAHLNEALSHLTFDPASLGSVTVTFTATVLNPDDGLAQFTYLESF